MVALLLVPTRRNLIQRAKERNKKNSITEVLKKTVYDMFWGDNVTEAQQFMETELNQLLEKSSWNVTYGSSGDPTMTSGMVSCSKTSFVA